MKKILLVIILLGFCYSFSNIENSYLLAEASSSYCMSLCQLARGKCEKNCPKGGEEGRECWMECLRTVNKCVSFCGIQGYKYKTTSDLMEANPYYFQYEQ